MLILIADLAGTLVFAIEGALAAMQAGLDVFGVMVLAVVTGSGGGALRDVLIGATPPAAVSDLRYAAVAFTAGAATFVAGRFIPDVAGQVLLVLDAGGLALFAVAGTGKALACGISPFMATLMGTITGVGGGTLRDVLLMRVPAVLRVDIYATAALAGSVVMVLLLRLRVRPVYAGFAGALVCLALRLVSMSRHWQLPTTAWS